MLGPQAVPTIAGVSSVMPSQSLSRPSHTSGPIAPEASPQESSHPSVGSPLRSTKPRAQLATRHVPAMHAAVALTAGQARPQPPQLATSVMVLKPLSVVPSQSLSRPSHTSGPDAVHSYSQPLAGSRSRSTAPARHAPIRQTPATQAASARSKTHALPQRPQLMALVVRSKPSSVLPSQSLSRPSQTSAPVDEHSYSHPLAGMRSRSTKPTSHCR